MLRFRIATTLLIALCASTGAIASGPKSPAAAAAARAPTAAVQAPAPKLILVLVVDGLPAEQVQRYRDQFGPGGFRRLMEQGAMFTDAHQAHGVTVTAVGHSAILTGAYPYRHGIINNYWIGANGQQVYCTEDIRYKYIGEETGAHDGTAPTNLRVDTLGDQLRYATGNRSKVLTVSGKDRGAILLAGKTGTAYMYMDRSGDFASSTFYMQSHPAWVQRFDAAKPQDRYYGKAWTPLLPAAAYAGDAPDYPPTEKSTNSFPFVYHSASGQPDAKYYESLKTGPAVDELTLEFARAAIQNEQLGRNPAGVPDLLGVSLSGHDYVNHAFGPESRMSHDHLQQLDRLLAHFFADLDRQVGMDNVLVVLTADHGFTNTPEFSRTRHIDALRIDSMKLLADLDQALAARFGLARLVKTSWAPEVYLDYDAIEKKGLARAEVEDYAARWLLRQPGIAQVFTRTQFERGLAGGTRLNLLMQRAWNRQLSGDLMLVTQPYTFFGTKTMGSTHGAPYAYDTNVPLFMLGQRWIRPGHYRGYTEVVDIAPTLASLLRVRPPAGAEGRVLAEALR